MNPFTEQIEHEDLLQFINSCFSGSSQAEFYSSRAEQSAALDFLHAYICINYRSLYAATLALGINHHNMQRIVINLLSRPAGPHDKTDLPESELIRAALRKLPPQRVYKLFAALAEAGVNNRRIKATVRDYLGWRDNLSFDAVKYKRLLTIILRHVHFKMPPEVHEFLYVRGWKQRKYTDPLIESYRQAHYSAQALYQLPLSLAEGLAQRLKISRKQLLDHIANLTDHERLRLQNQAKGLGVKIDLNPRRVGLTQLLIYILSLDLSERQARLSELDSWVETCRQRFIPGWLGFGRLAVILDNSFSSSGSRERANHPLAIALGAHYLLAPLAKEYQLYWLNWPEHPLLVSSRGQSGIAARLLDALEWGATEIIIVSDGAENDPAGATDWLMQALSRPGNSLPVPRILHVNPVLNPLDFTPVSLSPQLPVVGIRQAEDLPALWMLALFARRVIGRRQLETYLRSAADVFIETVQPR